MTDKIAVLIVNYNMPERADALYRHIAATCAWPHDIILVDNGSDIAAPSKYTSLWLPQNRQTTGGWLAGLKFATAFESYFAYWFLITSAEFPAGETDPLAPLASLLKADENAVGVHPALTADSTTAWKHLYARGKGGCRQTWMIDNIASLYRAEWFDSIGRFDPALTYAWGIDLETCWKARQAGRTLWVCEDVTVKKVTDIGYTMGRMNMSAAERRQRASDNMRSVLSARYGAGWWERMTAEYMDPAWK